GWRAAALSASRSRRRNTSPSPSGSGWPGQSRVTASVSSRQRSSLTAVFARRRTAPARRGSRGIARRSSNVVTSAVAGPPNRRSRVGLGGELGRGEVHDDAAGGEVDGQAGRLGRGVAARLGLGDAEDEIDGALAADDGAEVALEGDEVAGAEGLGDGDVEGCVP